MTWDELKNTSRWLPITGGWIWDDNEMTKKLLQNSKETNVRGLVGLKISHLNIISITVHSLTIRWLIWDDSVEMIAQLLDWHELRDDFEMTG